MIRCAILALVVTAACASPDLDEVDVDTDAADELDMAEAARPPQFHGRFGSPTIVRDGDKLHAYFAIQRHEGERVNVTHARSDDDGQTWIRIGDALPELGQGAVADGSVWAPGAAKLENGRWMLYYTAVEAGTESHMCIFRAHAPGPQGPFVDDFAGPLVCPDRSLWAIDPSPVRDAHGAWHLLARVDEAGGNNTIAIRKLGEYGRHFAEGSDWITLTRIDQGGWEEPVMENASMVRLDVGGEKRWFVFYSGGSYRNDSYGVGYADCGKSIAGPCVKRTPNRPWLASRPELQMFGPGTPSFYRDQRGATIMAVNTWKFSGGQDNPKNQGGQIMHLFEVHIGDDGKPVATFVRRVE